MGAPMNPIPDLDRSGATTYRMPVSSALCPPLRPRKLKEELKDYSGPLQPQLTIMDFSKEALIKLFKAVSVFTIGTHDGHWCDEVTQKWGDKVAWDLEDRLWETNAKYNALYTENALDFGLSTPVEKCLKGLQMNPALGGVYNIEVELLTPDVGFLTNWRCNSIPYFVKRGEEFRMWDVCWRMEQPLFQLWAHSFDPGIRCMPLNLIPKLSKDQPDCRWVYWLGEIKHGDPQNYVMRRNKEADEMGPPVDLPDYRGPLRKKLSAENFCKERVAKLVLQSSRVYRILDGQWHRIVAEKYSDEEAWKMQEKVWEDAMNNNPKNVINALNIQGSPLEQCLKVLQTNPAFGVLYNSTYELKSPNVGVVTTYSDPTREWFGKYRGDINLQHLDGEFERRLFEKYAQKFDPNIKVKTLLVPTFGRSADGRMPEAGAPVSLEDRVHKVRTEDKPICQWEFSIK